MKRTLSHFLTVALVLTLAACGSGSTSSSPAPEGNTPASATPETPPESQLEDTSPTEEQAPEGTDDSEKEILIAYFYATNNTEGFANHLNETLDTDLYEIVPETPYTSDDLNYNDSTSRSSQEINDQAAAPLFPAA